MEKIKRIAEDIPVSEKRSGAAWFFVKAVKRQHSPRLQPNQKKTLGAELS
jgi:hypothetical protein